MGGHKATISIILPELYRPIKQPHITNQGRNGFFDTRLLKIIRNPARLSCNGLLLEFGPHRACSVPKPAASLRWPRCFGYWPGGGPDHVNTREVTTLFANSIQNHLYCSINCRPQRKFRCARKNHQAQGLAHFSGGPLSAGRKTWTENTCFALLLGLCHSHAGVPLDIDPLKGYKKGRIHPGSSIRSPHDRTSKRFPP